MSDLESHRIRLRSAALAAAARGWHDLFDGHRLVMFHLHDGVVLQTRSGRIVTRAFPDLVAAAAALPPGCVLDGEVLVWTGQRTDFGAVTARAGSSPARAARLAEQLPASYAAFDILALDADLRSSPFRERRAATTLEQVLDGLGPPIQPVPMTTDRETALLWYETLPDAIGTEGLVVKPLNSLYPRREQRVWQKMRHTHTREAEVIGVVGSLVRPAALVLRSGRGAPVLSGALTAAVRLELLKALAARSESGGTEFRQLGETRYLPVAPGLVVEVEEGTTRHAVVPRIVRVRSEL
ncbi:ATP-dependent DNA ligase [Streptomyces erythrochromogenes]|uniref:ATP-dependent DNA ligase n=1 Tax=Streptomyces erythrochromogenes TaxID=285574 RepID=UPI003441ED16